MSNDLIELSKYRIEKSKEDLEASKVAFEHNQLKNSLNRSYYSVFHAMRAVHALDGFDSKKHSGVIAYFTQNYLKTEVLERSLYLIIDKLSKMRNQSDYDDFYIVSREETEKQLKNAEIFNGVIEGYLIERWKQE